MYLLFKPFTASILLCWLHVNTVNASSCIFCSAPWGNSLGKVMNVYFEQLRQRCLEYCAERGPLATLLALLLCIYFIEHTIHILCYAERSYLSWRLSRPSFLFFLTFGGPGSEVTTLTNYMPTTYYSFHDSTDTFWQIMSCRFTLCFRCLSSQRYYLGA